MKKYDMPESLYLDHTPDIAQAAFVAPGARLVGNVVLKRDASVWYNAVLRADINYIEIGERTNLQDGVIVHLENDRPCVVGNDVTVGHGAILHGCVLEDGCLIGMGAIVLNGAVVKRGAVVGAGAVVRENMVVEAHQLVVGIPAKPVKALPSTSYDDHVKWAAKYVALAKRHKNK